MKLILALSLLVFVCSASLSHEASFKSFMLQHEKEYSTHEEYQYRLGVYKSNLEFIENHNRQNLGFTVAMNKFGDLTVEEFAHMFNTLRFDYQTFNQTNVVALNAVDLPTTVDWRTKGVVTPVKDQGQCGSCWAFSTTGSTEGQHALKTGHLVSLSEQNLMDCSTSYGNMGCNGGLMDQAFRYIINNHGIDTEASYPYEAHDDNCRYNAANKGASITSYQDVPTGSESALQTAVGTVGPISVAIDASHSSFQFYSGGVYYEPACSATQLDHGVLAAGYGTSGGSDYWLVKNSWSAQWGLQGYIMMSRNRNNNCGIATAASYPQGASA
jgi:cathepsin L